MDPKQVTLKRISNPIDFNGFERTYSEIVKVEDGIAHPKTSFAKTILLQSRDYVEIDPSLPAEVEKPHKVTEVKPGALPKAKKAKTARRTK